MAGPRGTCAVSRSPKVWNSGTELWTSSRASSSSSPEGVDHRPVAEREVEVLVRFLPIAKPRTSTQTQFVRSGRAAVAERRRSRGPGRSRRTPESPCATPCECRASPPLVPRQLQVEAETLAHFNFLASCQQVAPQSERACAAILFRFDTDGMSPNARATEQAMAVAGTPAPRSARTAAVVPATARRCASRAAVRADRASFSARSASEESGDEVIGRAAHSLLTALVARAGGRCARRGPTTR